MKRISQILSVGAALALGAPAVQAQVAAEPTRADALAGALAGSEEGVRAMERYLDSAGAAQVSADRAAGLIRELRRSGLVDDPKILQQAADRISSAASRSFVSARIYKTRVTSTFRMDEKRIGFDFGPPDAETRDGFQTVTTKSEMVKGPNPSAMRRPEGESLLRDGIRNLRQVKLPVANGKYRVMIATDDIGVPEATANPYGSAMKVNGERVRVAAQAPKNWVNETYLAEPQSYLAEDGAAAADEVAKRGNAQGPTTGGMVVIETVVENGELQLVFDLIEGQETYLTGVILEPAGEESVFAPSAEAREVLFTRPEDILVATERVETARQELVSEIVAEAGPEQVARLLDLPEPVFEPVNDVSPN
ncbi:MAG: hypothetical protein TEF_20055 [Rhizobiales bacterium NRL2]|jgi:hypothetical protein|nr:MAG: hypothetical protein TEF_20055 [Rhizobiales bacterium NRL2]